MTALNESTRDVTAPSSVATTVAMFADPGALGLGAFALTTFVLSFANAGIISTAAPVLGLALFYGGIAQLLAGLWEFANKNTFGATAFCSYGAFWLAFWFLVSTKGDVASGAAGVGTFLLAWGIFTLYMTFAAWKTNKVIFAVLAALTLTYFALAIGAYSGTSGISKLGGYLGIITAILAWYGSFATVINSTNKRVVLPVWPSN
jgi:succinate-acetate transporter protein